MNISNIMGLAEQLTGLGFPDLGRILAKHICFKPINFLLPYQVHKQGHVINFWLFFEAVLPSGDYRFAFYDAAFQNTDVPAQAINGLSTTLLLEQMGEVDWGRAFDMTDAGNIIGLDESAFKTEMQIETIMESLAKLSATEEGKNVALALKHKFWSGAAYHGVIGNLPALKSKTEVSQRFYIVEGQAGISVDEAYRYLHNRWVEKEIAAQNKQVQNPNSDTDGAGGSPLRRKGKKLKASKSEK